MKPAPGTPVKISAPATVSLGDGSRADFDGWPGGVNEYVVTVADSDVTVSATYHRMNRLNSASNPPNGAIWTVLPASPDGFYNAASTVALSLTPREYAILETLMRRAGEVVSRVHLGETVWESDLDSLTNLVEVHISHLRRKVDRPGALPLIHTVRGYGYRLGPPTS